MKLRREKVGKGATEMKRETALCNAVERTPARLNVDTTATIVRIPDPAIILPELGAVFVAGDQAILPLRDFKKISREAWLHAVEWASRAHVQIQFFLGDLINRGMEQFDRDEAITAVMKATRLPRKTVVDYARVANRVGVHVRRSDLDFSYHRVVARLSPARQEYFLNLAVERELSVRDFKDAVAMRSTDSSAAATTKGSQRFYITLSGDDAFILHTLAAHRGIDPVDLIQKIRSDYLKEHSPYVDDVHTITAIESDDEAKPETLKAVAIGDFFVATWRRGEKSLVRCIRVKRNGRKVFRYWTGRYWRSEEIGPYGTPWPTDHPVTILTQAEVRRAYPGAWEAMRCEDPPPTFEQQLALSRK